MTYYLQKNKMLNQGIFGYIYMIKNTITDQFYIGSTNIPLEIRFKRHITLSKNNNVRSKLYENMRVYGIDNFKIEVLEIVRNTEKNIRILENYYITKFNAIYDIKGLNKNLPNFYIKIGKDENYHKLYYNEWKKEPRNLKRINRKNKKKRGFKTVNLSRLFS